MGAISSAYCRERFLFGLVPELLAVWLGAMGTSSLAWCGGHQWRWLGALHTSTYTYHYNSNSNYTVSSLARHAASLDIVQRGSTLCTRAVWFDM